MGSDDWQAALTAAQGRVPELQAKTEELNKLLSEAEEVIRQARLGVSARVPLDGGVFLEGQRKWLCWRKLDRAWALAVYDEASDSTQALLSASREQRTQAVPQLGALFRELCTQVGVEIRKVTEATAACQALVDEIRDVVALEKAKGKKP